MSEQVPIVTDDANRTRIVAGCLAIGLGWLGVHKFYLRRYWPGIQALGLGIIGIIMFPLVFAVVALTATEGIVYLTRTDEQFHNGYIAGKREWF